MEKAKFGIGSMVRVGKGGWVGKILAERHPGFGSSWEYKVSASEIHSDYEWAVEEKLTLVDAKNFVATGTGYLEVFRVGGKFVSGDNKALYRVIEVLENGTALLEGERHGNRVFAEVTGRKVHYEIGGCKVRVRFFEVEDIGKTEYEKLSETLRPKKDESWGGWAWL